MQQIWWNVPRILLGCSTQSNKPSRAAIPIVFAFDSLERFQPLLIVWVAIMLNVTRVPRSTIAVETETSLRCLRFYQHLTQRSDFPPSMNGFFMNFKIYCPHAFEIPRSLFVDATERCDSHINSRIVFDFDDLIKGGEKKWAERSVKQLMWEMLGMHFRRLHQTEENFFGRCFEICEMTTTRLTKVRSSTQLWSDMWMYLK